MSTATELKKIQLLDIRTQTASIRAELDAAIGRVLDHCQFILGPEVKELEQKIADYTGSKFAISCASGSDALLLPLMALGVGPGDKVVTSPFTFFATGGAIARLGATPVYLDIDPETFNLDPAALARYMDSLSADEVRTVKAIIPVHLFGQCAEMTAINEVSARFGGIPVIEDAAQAIGSRYDNRPAGSLGLCGCFSFFPSKNLGGFGDGGMITTDDAAFAEKLRVLRVHGSKPKYYHQVVGVNSRLDTLQAAILLVKLRYLDGWTETRRRNADLYRKLFAGFAPGKVTLPVERANCFHVYNQFTIRVNNRDEVRKRLTELGVSTEIYYPVSLHEQVCFANLGYKTGDIPHSEAAAKESVSLPIDPMLSTDDIEAVVERIAQVL